MSPQIEKIEISAFRGILEPLELNFEKGERLRSMIIYGRNGTGKSSVTDAMEWFHRGYVDHLRREGAGADAYPHRDADPENAYVEVEFAKDDLETIRLSFNPHRKTMPEAAGDIEAFRELAPHPFYIRFEDLKEFVYQTKTEKYDRLAQLMGFEPQVEFQRDLQRTLNKVEREFEERENIESQRRDDLKEILNLPSLNEKSFLDALQGRLKRNGLDPAETPGDVEKACATLEERVENDPLAKRISKLNQITEVLEQATRSEEKIEPLRQCVSKSNELAARERSAANVLLLRLYEAGEKVLSADSDRCPLCGQSYEGDLLDHVQGELEDLRVLKDTHESLEKARRLALSSLGNFRGLSAVFDRRETDSAFEVDGISLASLRERAEEIEQTAKELEAMLENPPDTITDDHVSGLKERVEELEELRENFEEDRTSLLNAVEEQKKALEEESDRTQLIDDYNTVRDAIEGWEQWREAVNGKEKIRNTFISFKKIVDNYVDDSLENVNEKFKTISNDVQKYFEVLEENTEGLSEPRLRLLSDKRRAVVLEAKFHGETTSPAYKYLSESQLNSFGLSVFLASAKRFNSEFKFIILDDVVNSLDGYKRPKLIEIVNRHLGDHQFVIMTHDNVWRDRLFEKFSHWKRVQFSDWKSGVGPIKEKGKTKIEEVRDAIKRDKPVIAGRILGPYIERRLRYLCENMGAKIKYERNPKYTLDDLLNSLISRVKNTLGKNSNLYDCLIDFKEERKFRNLCAHGVTPQIQISAGEIKDAYISWNNVEEIVRCDNNECNKIYYISKNNKFVCNCGNNVIKS